MAGDHASRLFAAEAPIHYRRGLEALESLRPNTADVKRRRVDTTISLANDVLLGKGGESDLSDCTERLHKAEALAESLVESKRATADDRARMARVHAWLGRAYGRQDTKKRSEYLDKVVASEVRDPELAAFVGYVYLNQGRFDAAESMLATAVSPLQTKQRWLEWVNANGALAVAAAAQKRCSEGLKRAELGLARSKNLEGQAQTTLVITANNFLAWTCYLCGDVDRAVEISQANRKAAAQTHNQLLETFALTIALQATTHDDTRLETAKQIHAEHADPIHNHPVLLEWRKPMNAKIAHMDKDHPDHPIASRMAEEAVKLGHERGNIYGEALAHRVWAEALEAQDSSDPEIDVHMARSRDLFRQGNCLVEVDRTHAIWDELRVKRGDPPAR